MSATRVLLGMLCLTAMVTMAFHLADQKSGNPSENRENPHTPRIDFIVPCVNQPHQNDPAVIWYDDFNGGEKKYLESTGDIDTDEFFGTSGGAMKAGFKAGETVGEGNRKIAFGDFPGTDGSVVRAGETFNEIYWRIYVKHEYGWQGSPAKMSRATSIISGNWQQAMISHVWSGKGNSITLDPASGIEGQSATVRTTKYNDFENLNWLGNAPSSEFQISSTEESGTWILVEAHTKLNTPGKSDGQARLWIDDRLEAIRDNLNFRGSYTGHGINAVFLESYWNSGSIKTQGRWYDNFVVSTKSIGPVVCPPNPILKKTPYHGPGSLAAWEVQLATDYESNDIVFKSKHLDTEEQVVIDKNSGTFSGSLKGGASLSPEKSYFCRVRQQSTNGEWSEWSRWHQSFNVKEAPVDHQNILGKAIAVKAESSFFTAGINCVHPESNSEQIPLFEETELFVGGQDDINTYRIPSLICTKNGTVMAFCEGRRDNNGDGSPTHLVLKRSLKNTNPMVPPEGEIYESRSRQKNMTWQPMQILLYSKKGDAYMNPVPVIDSRDGTIFLLVNHYATYGEAENAGKGLTEVWVMKSIDDGATWTEPVDITPNVGNIALGPGIGIQMHHGRLVAPVYDGVIFSDNHGKTWKAGNKTTGPVSESQVVELADGSLMLNTRGYPHRTVALSEDKGDNWKEPYKDSSLTDSKLWGGCQASLIRYTRQDEGYHKNRLLFANPADTLYRFNITVRISYDEGKSWPVAKIIKKGTGAYSCLTVFPDGTIGIIYETGKYNKDIIEYYAKLSFARFNLEWLSYGKDYLNPKH